MVGNNKPFTDEFKELLRLLINVFGDKVATYLLHNEEKLEEKVSLVCVRDYATGEICEDDKLSFLPAGKMARYDEDGSMLKTYRQQATIGKVIRNLIEPPKNTVEEYYEVLAFNWIEVDKEFFELLSGCKDVQKAVEMNDGQLRIGKRKKIIFEDKYYELFVNRLKSLKDSSADFVLVDGELIRDYYHEENYYTFRNEDDEEYVGGTLGDSCMRHDECQRFFDIYVESSACRLLVLMLEGKILGRALVWETDRGTFMDRIYTVRDHLVPKFIAFAQEKGWMYKTDQNAGSPTRVMKLKDDGTYAPFKDVYLTVSLEKVDFEYFPYMDTFKYIDLEKMELSNNEDREYDFMLESTGGSTDEAEEIAQCSETRLWSLMGNMTTLPNDDLVLTRLVEYDVDQIPYVKSNIESGDVVKLENNFGYAWTDSDSYIEVEGKFYHIKDPKLTELEAI